MNQTDDLSASAPPGGAPSARCVRLDFEIYTFHIDFSGHVGNGVYVQWLEIARLRLFEEAGFSVGDMAARHGVIPVLTETNIRYEKALYFGDRVRLTAWIGELRPASAWVEYRFTNQRGERVASARQRGIYLHRDTNRPYRLGADERALLAPFVAPAAADGPGGTTP